MVEAMLAGYVLTSGSSALTRRTQACLSRLARVETGDLLTADTTPVLERAAGALAGWDGWTLVLVEGEVVDVDSVLSAVASGAPSAAPRRETPLSIAPDPLRLPGARLFGPGRLGAQEPGHRCWLDDGEQGDAEGGGLVSWELSQLSAAARTGHPGAAQWAVAQAVHLTHRQVDHGLDEAEALWLAELLLLGAEGDAALVRAQRALRGACSTRNRVRWVELGLAAAVTGRRSHEASDFCRLLESAPGAPRRQAMWTWWSALVADANQDVATSAQRWARLREEDPTCDFPGDPWLGVSRARRSHVVKQIFDQAATAHLRDKTSDPKSLSPLVDAWRASGRPAAALVESWPPEHGELLAKSIAVSAGASVEWRLDLLEALFTTDRAPKAALVSLAAPLAAVVGLDPAMRWSLRAVDCRGEAADALLIRAMSHLVSGPERVLAAVCSWLGSPESAPLLESVVANVHVDEVQDVLVLLYNLAPEGLDLVVDMMCADEAKRRAVDRVAGAASAG